MSQFAVRSDRSSSMLMLRLTVMVVPEHLDQLGNNQRHSVGAVCSERAHDVLQRHGQLMLKRERCNKAGRARRNLLYKRVDEPDTIEEQKDLLDRTWRPVGETLQSSCEQQVCQLRLSSSPLSQSGAHTAQLAGTGTWPRPLATRCWWRWECGE